jgi:hypothetical protein
MSAAERVNKFHEDCNSLISGQLNSSLPTKITAEVSKLKTWIQKHQYETLPDGHKTKLSQTLELYYTFVSRNIELFKSNSPGQKLIDAVSELLSDYLQLPEGKLVNAKDKKKILNWSTSINNIINPSPSNATSLSEGVKSWVVVSVENGMATLVNANDDEDWREDVSVTDINLYEMMRSELDKGGNVVVAIDEQSNIVSRIS